MKSIAIFTVVLLAGVFLFNIKGTKRVASFLRNEEDHDIIGQESLKHL